MLVACRDIQANEAVTWSYSQNQEFLDADYSTRNFNLLNTFRFVCRCERCQAEIPPGLAMHSNLKQYFDDLIRDAVRKEVAQEINQEANKASQQISSAK